MNQDGWRESRISVPIVTWPPMAMRLVWYFCASSDLNFTNQRSLRVTWQAILNLNVRDPDTLRVYPDLCMRKSQKSFSYWTLRIIWELRQFCNIKPCQIIKKMTKYRSFFLWLMEVSGEELFLPSRGDLLQSSLTEWPLLLKKSNDTHTPVALCSDACPCFYRVPKEASSKTPSSEFPTPHNTMSHSPWFWGLSLVRAFSRLTGTENANGTVLNPSPVGPVQLSGTRLVTP